MFFSRTEPNPTAVRRARRPIFEPLEGRALMSSIPSLDHLSSRLVRGQVAAHSASHGQTGHVIRFVPNDLCLIPLPGVTSPTTYTVAQIRHAYGYDQLPQWKGTGQTIAIVVAYNHPTVANDLHFISQYFGRPDATLSVISPGGTLPGPAPSTDLGKKWNLEAALDVEWAHFVAPAARILLVEAKSDGWNDLLAAVDLAVAQGAKQISMSFAGPDNATFPSSFDSHFARAAATGVTFLAGSGDLGYGAQYPAASPYVVAVGGTSLSLDSAGNRISEIGWSFSGGGPSVAEPIPSYQIAFRPGTKFRGTPDVSYDADPSTGQYVFDSSSGKGLWYIGAGTSIGTPEWAGIIALANQGRAAIGKPSLGTGSTYGTNQVLYAMAGGTKGYTNPHSDFYDVTAGTNAPGHSAVPGWDPVTGLGSPNAAQLVPDLINA